VQKPVQLFYNVALRANAKISAKAAATNMAFLDLLIDEFMRTIRQHNLMVSECMHLSFVAR
jgi:hypothetical protein